MPGSNNPPRLRLGQLDGVRAILLACVVTNHLVYVTPFVGVLLPGAWVCVDVFYILSGFFIGTILLKEIDKTGRINYRQFVVSRLFRVYPALLLMLLVVTVLLLRDGRRAGDLAKPVLTNMTFLFNWPFAFDWNWQIDYSILYTLGIEFQFYLLLPIVMIALVKARATRTTWMVTMFAIMGASALARALTWHGVQSFPGPYSYTHTRLDNLFLGVVVAMVVHWGWVGQRMVRTLGVLVLPAFAFLVWLLFTSSLGASGLYRWQMVAAGWTAAVVVLWLMTHAQHPASRVLAWKPIALVGEMSYAGYLWHYPLIFIVARHAPNLRGREKILLVVVLTLVVSYVTFRFVERPMNGLRRRYVRGRPTVGAPVAPSVAGAD